MNGDMGKKESSGLSLPEVLFIHISNAWSRMSFKMAILLGVCLQNAGYTLIRKYSTINEKVSSKEILLVAEIIKVAVGTLFIPQSVIWHTYLPSHFTHTPPPPPSKLFPRPQTPFCWFS